jgi:hypothetical protein
MSARPPKSSHGTARRSFLERFETLPVIALCAAVGLFLCSLANALARATLDPSPLIYWVGLLIIALPIFFRLSSTKPSYRERLVLLLMLGLALYCVKVVRDSVFFTFSDEFVHAFNAENIEKYNHLYHFNPSIPTTPYYPGLEGATSALMMLTGMSSFGAGIIVVGAARLTFMVALFFLFARLSGSARGAGLGVAIYTGTSNFLFWGVQFSYESLSLPLMVVVLMAFVERDAAPPGGRRAWLVPILLGIPAIAITHHLTSYALAVIFVALAVLYWLMKVDKPNPWPLAVAATGAAVGWLLIAANSTVGYLFPVLEGAIEAIIDTAVGESSPRGLFEKSGSAVETVASTPLPARGVALLAIAILGLLTLFGLRQVWRRERHKPLVLLFAAAAIAFFLALTLRFAPAAWETGNRAAGFLFLGLAFVAIYGAAELLRRGPNLLRRRLALTGALGIVMVGGAISGWPWDIQLARPLQATAHGGEIDAESLALAKWSAERIPNSRFAAPESDARLLLEPGGQIAYGGQGPDIEDIVDRPDLDAWELPLLERNHLHYLVADRRLGSEDTLRGFFFEVEGQYGNALRPKGVVQKFSEIPVGRIWHSGRLSVFNLKDHP